MPCGAVAFTAQVEQGKDARVMRLVVGKNWVEGIGCPKLDLSNVVLLPIFQKLFKTNESPALIAYFTNDLGVLRR